MATKASLESVQRVEQAILHIRGHRVILDGDLAAFYGVPTKRLNEQVRRNLRRFPDDFMFRLTRDEAGSLRSQFATLKKGRGAHGKYHPLVFTEHGAIMAATVLSSERAIEASLLVVRAFVRLREILATHKDLARKLHELEAKYDHRFTVVFDAIHKLMAPSPRRRRRMGFRVKKSFN